MIVKVPLVLALIVCIKDVSSASFSKVFFQNGRDYPYEHVQYSAPSFSYSPHIAKLTAAPVSSVLPYSASYVPYAHPSSIYEYPGHVASIAPSAKFVQYQNPGVPLVVAPQSDHAGYEYSYVVFDDHKAQLELSDGPAAHGGYSFLQPEGFNAYIKSYVPPTEHVQHVHTGHSAAAPCPEVENEHLTSHAHHETVFAESKSSEESVEHNHGDNHEPTHNAHESHEHESHHKDHGHDNPPANHESHGHDDNHEGREETEHPHELHHDAHEGHDHSDHDHSSHDHGMHSSSSEEHEHPHGKSHDHEHEHAHAHVESQETQERAHGHEGHDENIESLELSQEHVEHHGNHHAEVIHEKHASHLEESSESIETEAHDLVASRHIEHSDILVPYSDIIKCVQAAMHGITDLSQPHHPESPLTYIVMNKPC